MGKLIHKPTSQYFVAIKNLFTKNFLIEWENDHDEMANENTIQDYVNYELKCVKI